MSFHLIMMVMMIMIMIMMMMMMVMVMIIASISNSVRCDLSFHLFQYVEITICESRNFTQFCLACHLMIIMKMVTMVGSR